MNVYKDKQKLFSNIEDNETIIKNTFTEEKNHADAKRRKV
jgi:hypothetical protein